MAGVGNVGALYNNGRKVSNKLTFEVKQSFSARVINSEGGSEEVTLKLLDGWQFPAKLDKPLGFIPKGLLKFEVEGYENGKLKLKLLEERGSESRFIEGSLEEILHENNMDSKDHYILEKMAKFNMPLTKENIEKVKSIIDFKERIQKDSSEEKAFTGKYLSSKNIMEDSIKGREVVGKLKSFFNELKTLSVDDIFTLIENDIDLTADNIKSYVKLFKEELALYKNLEILKSALQFSDNEIKFPGNFNGQEQVIGNISEDGEVLIEDISLQEEIEHEGSTIKAEHAQELKQEGELKIKLSLKDSIEGAVKDYIGHEIALDSTKNNFLSQGDNYFSTLEEKLLMHTKTESNSSSVDESIKDIKNHLQSNRDIIINILKEVIGQRVVLTEDDFSKMTELAEEKAYSKELLSLGKQDDVSVAWTLENESYELSRDLKGVSGNEITKLRAYSDINIKPSNTRANGIMELLRNIAEEQDIKAILSNSIKAAGVDLVKSEYSLIIDTVEKIPSEHIVNVVTDEVAETISEGRLSNKEISNVHNQELGNKVDESIRNAINKLFGAEVPLSDEDCEKIFKLVESNLQKNAEVKVANEGEGGSRAIDQKSAELVKGQISIKTSELKDIIKMLISSRNELKPESMERVIGFIRNSINDFKVFNSISNQYYYMDLPLKLKEHEYPCKLIIKDERKKGKKIDSKNVKLVVSVKTVNMGIIDSYIKVRDNHMNISIKCSDQWLKILELAKEKLLKNLSGLGYNVFISIEKSEEDANLSNCGEFFGDSGFGSINTRV
jgi:hypothetical protein